MFLDASEERVKTDRAICIFQVDKQGEVWAGVVGFVLGGGLIKEICVGSKGVDVLFEAKLVSEVLLISVAVLIQLPF